MAWLESLLDLLNAHLKWAELHEQCRTRFMLDCSNIWEEMDSQNQGWVSHGGFRRWVSQNCHYSLTDNDLLILQPLLDDARDGQITRDEFMTAFNAPEEIEAVDHDQAE